MSELSAEIQLRPTRIGFLVRPNDLASVRKVMRASVCLWGGIYNPIIPVFDTGPRRNGSRISTNVSRAPRSLRDTSGFSSRTCM